MDGDEAGRRQKCYSIVSVMALCLITITQHSLLTGLRICLFTAHILTTASGNKQNTVHKNAGETNSVSVFHVWDEKYNYYR